MYGLFDFSSGLVKPAPQESGTHWRLLSWRRRGATNSFWDPL